MLLSKMTSFHIFGNASKLLRRNLRPDEYTRAVSYSNKLSQTDSLFQRSSVQVPKASSGLLVADSSMSPVQCRMSSSGGDHVRLWQIERITSVALPVLLPACLILESPVLDSLLAVLVVIHTHWGLEAIVVDYARPIVVGTIVPKVLHLLLNLLSVVTLAGLLVLVYNGPGIAKTVKNVWAIGKEESANKK
ncbi:succinate dehydrogenase [ubiquinone] cytochrome b small subunit, mitochondrial [Belonocnema kinseyi]|uniref:succinate dehydrogenase [ubiquinone] cytochrome b small subunit, mitochondrial n=1 Tax=Belonocnema kinseyi TaxID=2817044 RepID=UPI00143D305B|nr:succinate dehydrogenase [ubiquinone] cytochrome b small subunit, mitochondrial [Belonocnema kinseyi]